MSKTPEEKLEAMRRKLERVRVEGAEVTIHHEDGTDTVFYVRRLSDGTVQWTDQSGRITSPPNSSHAA